MLANRFVAALASRTLSLNQRIQILSRRTLREKLITFLSQYATAQGDTFTVPFDRASMPISWAPTAAPCPGNWVP